MKGYLVKKSFTFTKRNKNTDETIVYNIVKDSILTLTNIRYDFGLNDELFIKTYTELGNIETIDYNKSKIKVKKCGTNDKDNVYHTKYKHK